MIYNITDVFYYIVIHCLFCLTLSSENQQIAGLKCASVKQAKQSNH